VKGLTALVASDRACLAAIVLGGLLLVAPGLGARDLWDPDEPRTAAVTAAIVAGGSWAAPRLDDRPWLEKPPLYYWLAAAASLAAGRVDEATVRLPANAAAIACAIVVFLFGRELWGRRAGLLAAIVLLTTFDFAIEARWARPDMLLGLLLTLAAFAAWKACAAGAATRSPSAWAALFWGAVGLGILDKGPVALLPLAGAAVFAFARRRPAALGRLVGVWGVAAAALPVLAWTLAWSAAAGTPFPVGDVLARFALRVTAGVHHPHPPLHILSTLPLALLPWGALLPAAIAETWPRHGTDGRDERAAFVLSLLITDLALFAMSEEKRGIYLLPMVPLAALLVGRLWDVRLYPWDPPPPARAVAAGLAAWLAATGVAVVWVLALLARAAPGLERPAALLGAVGLAAAAAPLLLWRRAGAAGAIGLFGAGAALAVVVALHVVMPAIDPYKSPREFGRRVAAAAGDDPVAIFRDPHRGIAWYAGRPLVLLPTTDALNAYLAAPRRALVVSESEAWEGAAPATRTGARVVANGSVGHRDFVLVESAPASGAPPAARATP
jgi:4-amino-4-deoxy-L-arabinose transferase-like glycosyltransferase